MYKPAWVISLRSVKGKAGAEVYRDAVYGGMRARVRYLIVVEVGSSLFIWSLRGQRLTSGPERT
jgi:hypothetical protein